MYSHDDNKTTTPQLLGSGCGYVSLKAYLKNWSMMMCPSRRDTVCQDPSNPLSPRCLCHGYNGGFISDTGYGLSYAETKDALGKTLRPGRPLAAIAAPADWMAFGDTYDNPGYSIAMDNILSWLRNGFSSGGLRHQQCASTISVEKVQSFRSK